MKSGEQIRESIEKSELERERALTPSFGEAPLINRELSWVEFNRRVLGEALNPAQPLLERLKFLSIFSTNLDEFFMVRVSGLQGLLETNPTMLSPDGVSPATQLRMISEQLKPLLETHQGCLRDEILPGLAQYDVRIIPYSELSEKQRDSLRSYFNERIFSVLTPLSVDPSHPFPYISNISLNLATLVVPERFFSEGRVSNLDDDDDVTRFARVKIPPRMPRLIPVNDGYNFVLLEELVAAHIDTLFPGMRVLECQPFRITRDADIEIEEDEANDLLKTVERQLRQRKFGFAVRLEVSSGMSPSMVELLRTALELDPLDVYTIDGPLNIPDLMMLTKLDLPDLKDKPFQPSIPPALRTGETIFDVMRHQDILIHQPYETFAPVVEFLRAAAKDPNVMAIKQTLYRIGPDSPLVDALIEAAERGKQVAVLVELKARFDEENNILWARRLEQAGVHVVYGVIGLKTHAKLALVVRQEGTSLRRYLHLGTGNYNAVTARIYTDFGLFTCNPDFGADASELFNYLTGYSRQERYRKLLVSPVSLRTAFVQLIRREVQHHKAGRSAGFIAKFNSLTDTALIEELYAASQAGLPINLIVRGICCLRPGVAGLSETIRVGSIVGRFLEHSRAYRFLNGGQDEIYLGSADLMSRNLDRRVEVLFPLLDERIKERVREIMDMQLADNVKMRWLQPDGAYTRPLLVEDKLVDSQAASLVPSFVI